MLCTPSRARTGLCLPGRCTYRGAHPATRSRTSRKQSTTRPRNRRACKCFGVQASTSGHGSSSGHATAARGAQELRTHLKKRAVSTTCSMRPSLWQLADMPRCSRCMPPQHPYVCKCVGGAVPAHTLECCHAWLVNIYMYIYIYIYIYMCVYVYIIYI